MSEWDTLVHLSSILLDQTIGHLFYWFAKKEIKTQKKCKIAEMDASFLVLINFPYTSKPRFLFECRTISRISKGIVWLGRSVGRSMDQYQSFLFICISFFFGECVAIIIRFWFYCHLFIDTIHWDSIQIKYQYKRFYRYLFCDVFYCIVSYCSLLYCFRSVFFFSSSWREKKEEVK